MRRLKLQMQITVDGFVAGPDGQLDWSTGIDKDEKLLGLINHLTDTSDTILLGRNMTPGFIKYWEGVTPASPEYDFAQKMVRTPKVMFSQTQSSIEGKNVRAENGLLANAIKALKSQTGKDIIVYGGVNFVSSLLSEGLIDELNFFVNPVAIGRGKQIFSQRTPLTLVKTVGYASGVVVNTYTPR